MRLLILILLLLFSAPTSVLTAPNPVQPLQIDGQTFCTAFSIHEKEGQWATAAHCAIYALDKKVTILGQEAYVVFIGYPEGDVAIFHSQAHAPALRMAEKEVPVGHQITIRGFPYGLPGLISTRGSMGGHDITIIHPDTGYFMRNDILDITVAGGNSGSPILNAQGKVTGVLWGGFNSSGHAIGVPFDVMQRLIGDYWKR